MLAVGTNCGDVDYLRHIGQRSRRALRRRRRRGGRRDRTIGQPFLSHTAPASLVGRLSNEWQICLRQWPHSWDTRVVPITVVPSNLRCVLRLLRWAAIKGWLGAE